MTNEIDLRKHYLAMQENVKKKEVAQNNDRRKVADWVRPSLVKRAQKRVDADSVEFHGSGSWVVAGNGNLGDHFSEYNVRYVGGKYQCDCQDSGRIGGDVRKKNLCSHMIAVMLHKEQNGYRINDNGNGSAGRLALDFTQVTGYSEHSQPQGDAQTGSDQGEPATLAQVDGQCIDTSGEANVDPEETSAEESAVPSPHDAQFAFSKHKMPQRITSFREAQWKAVCEIMKCYEDGADVVILDAPTGAGKTVAAETVRRLRRKRFGDRSAAYICNSITLQEQFKRDFPYAKVLKGRANYPTQLYPFPEYTCGDCTNDRGMADDAECEWCSDVASCSYNLARNAALRDELAVINTAYFLNEANWIGYTSGRDFVIVDECDTLESILMGFVQFEISPRMLEELGIDVPKKGSHMSTITEWFENTCIPAFKAQIKLLPKKPTELKQIRKLQRLQRGLQAADVVVRQLMDSDGESGWVRDNDAGPMVLKPVKVDWAGEKFLWQHGKKWLCMSATVISVDEFGESLGLNISTVKMESTGTMDAAMDASTNSMPSRPLNYQLVTHPMMFPKENRPIYVTKLANVTAKTKEDAYPRLAKGISGLLRKYPGERILVHTVSYDLAKYLRTNVVVDESREPWHLLVYMASREREAVIERYLNTPGAVLFASSLTRGADFKYDACRVNVVAKVPFLYLGDRQVSTRTHMKGGNLWYAVQTIRELVQATGRGVRSETDKCDTYILDMQYADNLEKRWRGIMPKWWLEARKDFRKEELL